jgi:hypothetical protein
MILGYFAHLVWDGDCRRAQQSGRECGATAQGNAGKTAAEVSLGAPRKIQCQIEDSRVNLAEAGETGNEDSKPDSRRRPGTFASHTTADGTWPLITYLLIPDHMNRWQEDGPGSV